MPRIPCCNYAIMSDLPKETCLPVCSPPEHQRWLVRAVLCYCPLYYWEKVGIPLQLSYYLRCPCGDSYIHGQQFSFIEFERFVSFWVTPAMIWSENVTNFVGAENEPRESVEKWSIVNIATEFAHKGINWSFNPLSAPHQGGIRETLLRGFNCVLYTILGTRRFTNEVLQNTFCLVTHDFNLRPLTPVSTDPRYLNAITPKQFLPGE